MTIHIRVKAIIGILLACAIIIAFLYILPQQTGIQVIKSDDTRIHVPIIMYHEIKPNQNGNMSIAPYQFESDLKYLQKNQYTTITMTQLIDYVYDNIPLPPKPIILTFDDGYYNNYVYALPLLEKYKMKAVISIIGKSSDAFSKLPSDDINSAHLTWEQLGEMQNSGCFEVQNHSYDLHSISWKRYGSSMKRKETLENYTKVLTDDLTACQNAIFEHLGVTSNTFTYPYGNISPDSVVIIKNMGFKASLSCKYGINLIDHNPDCLYCLMRIGRYPDSSLSKTLVKAEKTLKFRK